MRDSHRVNGQQTEVPGGDFFFISFNPICRRRIKGSSCGTVESILYFRVHDDMMNKKPAGVPAV